MDKTAISTSEEPAAPPSAVDVCVDVDPGICGFCCVIRVVRSEPKAVKIQIRESECRQIQRLATRLDRLSLRGLFAPLTRNPIFTAAEAAGCHSSCIVPSAVLKAAEAALEMALPKAVHIRFLPAGKKSLDA